MADGFSGTVYARPRTARRFHILPVFSQGARALCGAYPRDGKWWQVAHNLDATGGLRLHNLCPYCATAEVRRLTARSQEEERLRGELEAQLSLAASCLREIALLGEDGEGCLSCLEKRGRADDCLDGMRRVEAGTGERERIAAMGEVCAAADALDKLYRRDDGRPPTGVEREAVSRRLRAALEKWREGKE